jgi:hypothetical protein
MIFFKCGETYRASYELLLCVFIKDPTFPLLIISSPMYQLPKGIIHLVFLLRKQHTETMPFKD